MTRADTTPVKRRKFRPPVGPKLKKLLWAVFALVALIGVNSVYLVTIRGAEAVTGLTYQNYFFQWMFLLHLVLGVALIVPVVLFGALHIRNTFNRPNKRAVAMGYALFTTSLILLATGIVLTRVEIPGIGVLNLTNPATRSTAYWAHVITPLVAVWLYILHRLAGRRIKWRVGITWGVVAGVFALGMLVLQAADPRAWNVEGPASGEQYFFPSLARTSDGNFIPAEALMMDQYCLECHEDAHEQWSHSMHRFSSFNNPAYLFSITETRQVAMERDGDVQISRFCAGCHDTVPFFSGAFDDPEFDMENHPTANAGITCTSCHAITHVNSPRGNADYTIEEPIHYPFAYSDNRFLQWVNQQLVKANPDFHKKTFLKPLHQTPEFCAGCHKVHLPEELNAYKWLRGQNHYDPFLLSGVSGHGVTSFYYPPVAETNCNGCHMQLIESDQFAARDFDGSGVRTAHDHQFPSANTAIPHLLGMPDWVNERHHEFNEGVMRVDIFGVRDGAEIDAPLSAPIRPEVPVLEPGHDYLLETVIRTVKMGHIFTQGTADSNEIWLDVTVREGERVIGRSGGQNEEGRIDPWSHFVNAYVLDRDGNRIDRRNAQDIFTVLYSNQIPPGAGDVVHYAISIPEDVTGPVTVDVALRYRKFDTTYMQYVYGDTYVNDLPVMTLAVDSVTFPTSSEQVVENPDSPIVLWQRWNDFGIGLLRKGSAGSSKGELRGAADAFAEVEGLGRPDGPLNLARVLYKEGRLDEAVEALNRAATHTDPAAPPWTLAWFAGLVDMENGNLDDAIDKFTTIVEMDTAETRARQFDFSYDYRVLNQLGLAYFERSKRERGEANQAERDRFLQLAVESFEDALALDPENLTAHYNLAQVHTILGNDEPAQLHRALHAKYKPDDNAADVAIARARAASPAADHAAEAVVIYDLQRPDAYEYESTGGVASATYDGGGS